MKKLLIFEKKSLNTLLVLFIFLIMASCASTGTSPSSEETLSEYIWPPPPAQPRIKWLSQWKDRNDFGKPSEVLEFLVGKERVETLQRPNGIVSDEEGNIYVADSEAHIIFVFDFRKNKLRFLGLGRLSTPIGLAIDNKRNILFVSDSKLKKVIGFNKNSDDIVMSIGGPGEFKNPTGLVFDETEGNLYVTDTHAHVVKVYDKNARLISTIGKRGKEDGEFNYPSYLALDKSGRLFVVDSFNFRVQIFDSKGNFLNKFGKLGDASGSFTRPHGIGIDSDGNIYVVDAAFSNFQIFNEQGQLMLWVGNPGSKPGEFYLPTGLFIDGQDKIYISDAFNKRVQVFQYIKQQKPL